MPTSRSRRPRNVSTRERRRRKKLAQSRGERRSFATPIRPGQALEPFLEAEDWRLLNASVDAEARCDARAAYEHLRGAKRVAGSLTVHRLRDLTLHGDEAPGWMYARWCADQAMRWMLREQDPRADLAVRQTIAASYLEEFFAIEDPVLRGEFATQIAAGDWITQQLALYEYGGLRDFLDVRASDALIRRAEGVASWAEAPLGGYRLDRVVDDMLVVTDLGTGCPVELLNLGALTDRDQGTPVLGRVVEVSSGPGLMFESRPVEVDLETARDAARLVTDDDRAGWIEAISRGRAEGRLPRAFSGYDATLWSSDVVPLDRMAVPVTDHTCAECAGYESSSPRMLQLRELGLTEMEAEGLMVVELALVAARTGTSAAAGVSPHLRAVLLEPRVRSAAARLCAGADLEQDWLTLATCSAEPVRSWCRELAARCSDAA